ncbi:MAG: chorismate mutase [Rhodospirillales bacterium]|nr:chorismate mutase [Rhodospirillales bacterium]
MSLDQDLASVRSEIDAIDDAIHDLIIRRTELVEQVRVIKHDLPIKIQPSREAEIVYRIVGRHRGPFPKPELVAIWRQLINATLSFEGPFSVAAYMPDADGRYWDLARDQYGAYTPMTRHTSARSVIEAVRRHEAIVGVLPLPGNDDVDPWWRHLVTGQPEAPRIIAKLPFAGPASTRGGEAQALVICPVAVRPTGRDRTYIAADVEAGTGAARLAAALDGAGLTPLATFAWHEGEAPASMLYLVEVADFVGPGDLRLDAVGKAMGRSLNRLLTLGGYAEPLDAEALGPVARQASAATATGVDAEAS